MRGFVPFLPAALALGLGVAGPPRAWAQPSEPSSRAPTAGAAVPLSVWLEPSAPLEKGALEAALERELGRDVTFTDAAPSAQLKIRFDGNGHASVEYRSPAGEDLRRQVDVPPDRARSVQVVSWLTVNLVRDEASELLDELRARRRQEADRAASEQALLDKAAADKAAADKAAADKAAADKAAADKAAADKAAADKAAAEQARRQEPPELLRDPLRRLDAAVATPLSVLRDSVRRELWLQLALGYGDSGAIRGIGLSTGALRVRRELWGLGVGVGAVMVDGPARGILASAGYARSGATTGVVVGAGAAKTAATTGIVVGGGAALTGDLRGIAVGGGGAHSGSVVGITVGGGFSSGTSLQGLSVGGGFVRGTSLRGFAVGGGAALIRGPSEGLLLGGVFTSTSELSGVQISGVVNVSRELRGVAIAPVNVQRRVKGLQLGFVNVAEQVDGVAIGVLSFAKNGRVQPVLWTATDRSLHLGIKSIAGLAFTQLGAGVDLEKETFSYEGAVGMHLKLPGAFFLEPMLQYSARTDTADAASGPDQHRLHYLAQLGYRVGDKLDLLAAAGARHVIVGDATMRVTPEAHLGIAFF